MVEILIICLIFVLAGGLQGLTGFGAALVAIPFLSFVIDIKDAVPLTILNGLVINTYLCVKLRHYLVLRKILPLLLGAGPGVITGILFFHHVDSEFLKMLLGTILVLYSPYCLLTKPKPINPPVGWAYLAGYLTGMITVLLSAGGPPTIIYTTLTSWKKEVIKGTLIGFFTVNAYLAFAAQALGGVVSKEILVLFVQSAPAVLLGTIGGAALSTKIDRERYLLFVHLLLTATGVILILG